jgi:hypothetical protein
VQRECGQAVQQQAGEQKRRVAARVHSFTITWRTTL